MRTLLATLVAMLVQGSAPATLSGDDKKPGKGARPKVGEKFVPADVDKAHPVYETSFDDPKELRDWLLEGGKRMSIANGNLILESDPQKKNAQGVCTDHLVCWLRRELPADFLIEFTIRPRDRKDGLNIVFFNARGLKGESVLDPSLRARDGTFEQYYNGDFNCYHVSYWAAGRGTANLRKNKGFHLVAEGKDLVADAPADAVQTICVYKRSGSIRVTVDDVLAVAWDDDGTTGGPAHTHAGRMGLRQMGHSLRCEYGHVKIYPLQP